MSARHYAAAVAVVAALVLMMTWNTTPSGYDHPDRPKVCTTESSDCDP